MATTYLVLPTTPSDYKLQYDTAGTPYYAPVAKGTIPPLPVVPAGYIAKQSNADRTVNPNVRIVAGPSAPAAPAIASAVIATPPVQPAAAAVKAGTATTTTPAPAKAAAAAPALGTSTIETPATPPATALAAPTAAPSRAAVYLPAGMAALGLFIGAPFLILAGAGLYLVSSQPQGQ